MEKLSGSKKIAALILAGGLGTRLRSVVTDVPKVMAPVMGKPFLKILLDQLLLARFKEVLVCTGYMSEKIKQDIGQIYRNLHINYSEEKQLLGTGGAVIQAIKILPEKVKTILVMNGDSYLNIDLGKYIEWFIKKKIDCAIALKNVRNTDRYGSVVTDSDHKVIEFCEKKQNKGSGWINAGIYLFNRHLFDSFENECPLSLEKDILPGFVNKRIIGYECSGEFIDIGTPESYEKADCFFEKLNYSPEHPPYKPS